MTAILWMGLVVILGGDRSPGSYPGLVYLMFTVRTWPSSPGFTLSTMPILYVGSSFSASASSTTSPAATLRSFFVHFDKLQALRELRRLVESHLRYFHGCAAEQQM